MENPGKGAPNSGLTVAHALLYVFIVILLIKDYLKYVLKLEKDIKNMINTIFN